MPNLAANLSMMFTEVPFLDRFDAAARAGFKGVEFLFPYEYSPELVAAALTDAKLTCALFNTSPGKEGERGLAALPGREADFEASLAQAAAYAAVIKPRNIHIMAGVPFANADEADCQAVYRRNVKVAAQVLTAVGVGAIIEPINTRDIPGYFINRQDHAVEVLEFIGEPNAGLQMDLYHCQIVEGDVATKIRDNFKHIRHFQIAGVPDRHEPDQGEVNYPYLFKVIDELGYDGWIGCEYRPKGETAEGLGWARDYGIKGRS